VSVALLVASLFLYGQWQSALKEVEGLKGQVDSLERTNQFNQSTINSMSLAATKNAELVSQMGERNEAIQKQADRIQAQLNSLRNTEAEAALAAPFERGNASHDRQRAQLLRFSGNLHGTSDTDSP